MRGQGSLAVHTLVYLHKSVGTDFSSVPLRPVRSKGPSYLVITLLETILEVPCTAAERRLLSAVALSLSAAGVHVERQRVPLLQLTGLTGCCWRWINTLLKPKEKTTGRVIIQLAKRCSRVLLSLF